MAVISTFCKKGGVGKTTFIGYFAHYYAKQGKKVLVLSVDDQNSIFKIYGAEDKIFSRNDNYLEFLMAGHAEMGDILIEVRENLYLIKTLNTDKLSMKLTLERRQEKILQTIIDEYQTFFDYIFVDFPPSSSRLTEVLLDMSDDILLVVGLDSLGLGGFFNTIQYFIDNDINLNGIKYIVPNGYSKNKRAPKISFEQLKDQAQEFTPTAEVLPPINDRSIIKNIQFEGLSVFDDEGNLTPYDKKSLETLKEELIEIFNMIDI
ncbi:MAG TPA: ParA family protein [Acholeplasmataceae bacterium]|nr:ParA family protein [Acholeplasmataceae bacterium]